MEVTLEQFSSLVSRIYSSNLDSAHWPDMLIGTASTSERAGGVVSVDTCNESNNLSCLQRYFPAIQTLVDQPIPHELLQLLVPHLQRSISTQVRLRQLEADRGCLRSLLQYAQHGVILATRTSQVLFSNSVADEIFASTKGIAVRAGELYCKCATEQATLVRLLSAAGGVDTLKSRKSGSFCLKRPKNQRSLALHVLPIGDGVDDRFGLNADVMIIIVDPESDPGPQEATLRRLYELTKAEAVVAVRVARGEGLQTVADDLCVSLSTVRIHLQRVFEKTDTHRQAELVRLLLVVQAGIRIPE